MQLGREADSQRPTARTASRTPSKANSALAAALLRSIKPSPGSGAWKTTAARRQPLLKPAQKWLLQRPRAAKQSEPCGASGHLPGQARPAAQSPPSRRSGLSPHEGPWVTAGQQGRLCCWDSAATSQRTRETRKGEAKAG